MDKNARDKIPNVLALLMGMVGMTAMTVYCYGWGPEPFSPRDIATKAAMAWGVMLVMGYIVGMYGKQFMPEPPAKKNAVSISDEAKDGEAMVPVVAGKKAMPGAATVSAPPSMGGSQDHHIDENMLNILLNEAPDMGNMPLPPMSPTAGVSATAPTVPVHPPGQG